MAVRDALQQVQEARHAYTEKKYSDAVEHYRNALSVLPQGDSSKKLRDFVSLSLSDALIAKAIDYRSVGRYEEAVAFLKEAVKLAPSNKRAAQELSNTNDPLRHNPALTPQHLVHVEEVERLLTLANGYYDLGKYDEAVAAFNNVLKIDAYNSAARQGIERCQNARSRYYRTAYNSRRAQMLADVDKQWEEEVPDAGVVQDLENSDAQAPALMSADGSLEQSFSEALENMQVPHIVLDGVTIEDAVSALRNQIANFESQGIRASRSINLTLNLGAHNSPQYQEISKKLLNLDLSNISMKGVLEAVCAQLGLIYNYSQTGVELSYSGKDFGPMMDCSYTVPPHFFDVSSDDSSADEDDSEDDAFASHSSSALKIKRVNPMEAFKRMGVSFPDGSFARYSAATRQLTVRNTAFNQDEIRSLLSLPMEGPKNLVINAIIMEVSEKDMEELGFEWMVNIALDGSHFLGGGNNAIPAVSGSPVGGVRLGAPTSSMTDGLRSGIQAMSSSNLDELISSGSARALQNSSGKKAPGILTLYGAWQTADVQMVMRGLSQKKGVDILENPRVIMTAGRDEQVIFADVQEFFYPESYTSPHVSSNAWDDEDEYNEDNDDYNDISNANGAMVTPAHPDAFTFFGMTEDAPGGIGPILQIHGAELSDNNQAVTLALTLTSNKFEGFLNWGSPIIKPSIVEAGDDEAPTSVQLSPNYILMPIIKRYCENTSVTLRPGTVLVMGGLSEAKHVRFEDKIPVLGDLPLVGRFFRSEGESKDRRMMLMFLKVDVVDPTGRDVNTGERPSQATDGI